MDSYQMRSSVNRLTIQKHLKGDFENKLLDAAVYNLSDEHNQLRFSNYAYALRELFSLIIKRMAPKENVTNCEWFLELNEKEQVARRDSFKYIIQGGLSDEYVRNELKVEVSEVFPRLRDAYEALNKLTHISEKVFPINADKGINIVAEVEEHISTLFNKLDECHMEVLSKLEEAVGDAAIYSSVTETIMSIDELSTHSSLEEVYIEEVKIVEINDVDIFFLVTGSVDIGLQWGSNSDVRNDIGAVGNRSFPFSCEVRSPVDTPDNLGCEEEAFNVDTSSWWEGYYDLSD
ncbi:hypothetical protein WKH44_17805 [Pantoea agglomerans]|uniref:pPIWI-associating nuclease domain-containing protein n=3 Tax=Enterobacter agglomerans TaxID=549 RepID=UPI001FCE9F5B|nr:hypothetical protein [Pantoea agglomerans]WNK35009.1 hypothetical protein RM158_18550 [Pantoea agglomerans]